MAEKQDAEQEPSIEEILDSIRQIISDDDEENEEAAEVQAEEPEAEPAPAPEAPEEDVVELTDKLDEPEPPEDPIEVDMKDPEEDILPAPEPEPEPEPEPPPKVDAALPPADFDSILTEKAENATMDAFTDLARRASVERGGNVTVEDIVREEIRPMLREWVDRHLPSLVERLVQKELERISRQVQDD